ncbi:hypothetical protein [Prosthecobacter sp.]|uniref:hypothetical protein n=1 Tax=Prosthecobacter sp. TaxID=1965333 RepID=UPI003784019E
MKASFLTGLSTCGILGTAFCFPLTTFAGLQVASDPPRPRTPLDARNAFFAGIIHWLLLVTAAVALAWLVWWALRLRRK